MDTWHNSYCKQLDLFQTESKNATYFLTSIGFREECFIFTRDMELPWQILYWRF